MLKGTICTGIASLVLVIPAYVSSSALIVTKKDRESAFANSCNLLIPDRVNKLLRRQIREAINSYSEGIR